MSRMPVLHLMRPEGLYEDRVVVGAADMSYIVDTQCIRHGFGIFADVQDSRIPFVRVSAVNDTAPKYNPKHSVMGLQELFYPILGKTAVAFTGHVIPYIAPGENVRDSHLVDFIKDLEKKGINVEMINGIKFYGNKVFLYRKVDLPLMKIEGDPRKHVEHVPFLSGVYMVLGKYQRDGKILSYNGDLINPDTTNPLHETYLSSDEIHNMGLAGNNPLDLDEIVMRILDRSSVPDEALIAQA